MKMSSSFLKGITAVLIAATVYSCSGGGSPKRKEMPEFDSYNGFEGAVPFSGHGVQPQGAYGFTTTNVDMMLNGSMQGFVSVALPDASNDSLVVNLLHSFKPFALPLISSWSREQRRGVMIDLSSHTDVNVHRTDYLLTKNDDFTISVVVIWDQGSAARVAALREMANELPFVKFSCTSGFDPSVTGYLNK